MVSTTKKIPKTPIKFSVNLNEEQRLAKEEILKNKVTFLKGKAGSGKSLLAVQTALDCLFKKQVDKIYITRPAVDAGESYGYLPGDKNSKMAPYTDAIYDNMYTAYNKEKVDKEIRDGRIVVVPIGHMRGSNFSNAVVIIDEAQNVTKPQMELILTRLCKGSKMIFVGDSSQIDLLNKKQVGLI
jgi:phosphate starvation-inducible protein PhoH and related proteins